MIEVNPRVSRSSALASKATGYPIARLAAKIAVGRRLDEVPNAVTGKTVAAFEPALDYCVVKIPRWPFDKFVRADRTLGTQMKATGEVMAIDRSFEAALQKAVRSLEAGGASSLAWESPDWDGPGGEERLLDLVERPTDLRLWALMAALRRGHTPEELSALSGYDPWFTRKLARLVAFERTMADAGTAIDADTLWHAKRFGFSDKQIAALTGPCRRRSRGTPPRRRDRAGLQDGRYLRRRVHGADALLLLDLRGGGRGDAAARSEGGRARLRPDPHRPGDRVRLLLRSGRAVARSRGRRLDHDQL